MGRFPKFLQEGFADLTCGVDDRGSKYGNITILASDADSLSSYLDLSNYDKGNSYCYAAGYIFLRYLAKQISDSYDGSKSYAWKDGSSIVGTDAAELLTGNAKKQTIRAGAGNDTITAYGENMKIFGDDGDDYILTGTNSKNLTILAAAVMTLCLAAQVRTLCAAARATINSGATRAQILSFTTAATGKI